MPGPGQPRGPVLWLVPGRSRGQVQLEEGQCGQVPARIRNQSSKPKVVEDLDQGQAQGRVQIQNLC